MAKDKITEYDATAANNTDVGGVNLAENSMNPSDVNNAIREVMSHQKEAFGLGTPLFVDQTNNRVGVNKTPTVALDVSGDITFTGDLASSTSGTSNFRAGVNAGDAIASGGIRNVVVGDEAGTAITTGTRNIAIGYQALATEDTGSRSIAIGHQALTTQNGGTADLYNIGVGHNAGGAITTGVQGVYIGGLAGDADTSGGKNTYVGYNSGTANAGDQNVFIGHSAGSAITDGDKSTIIGKNDGNSGGLDIRTADNQIVISEGDGNVRFYSNAASFIAIGLASSTMFLVQDHRIASTDITGGTVDNTLANGWSNRRWTVVYAASGSINTSDENEKQDIEALSEKEKKVAATCKGLIKKYRWKDAVLKKGDNARIHVGIIAQDLKLAFEAEGLDASKYGMFCSDTWWEKEETINGKVVVKDFETEEEAPEGATKKTRLGVRYEELLAFIILAI